MLAMTISQHSRFAHNYEILSIYRYCFLAGKLHTRHTFSKSTLHGHDESLHFHELVHVIQWKLLGAKAFVAAYASGLERFGYRNSPLGVMAHNAQTTFEKSSQPFDVEKLVIGQLPIS